MKNRLKDSRFIKNISKLGFIIIGCLVLASFSPSLDGRAVVVDPGVFPEGLFAKTVGYLPGDIISVTNITGDATIDILVIGALDPSEGVAIMLSPEAAAAIGINKNSNNIVKITKRSNQDERVYGSAVIASNNTESSAPAVEQTKPVAEPVAEPVVEETKPPVYIPADDEIEKDLPVYEEEIWEEPVFDEKETVAATEPEEEIFSKPIQEPVEEEPVTEYEYFNDEALPEYYEEEFAEETTPEYIEETPVVEEPVEEAPVQEEQPSVYEEFKDDELDELPSDEEPVEEFETIPAEEEVSAEEPVEEPVEQPVEEPVEETIEEEFTDDEVGDVPAEEEEFIDEEPLEELEEEPVEEPSEDEFDEEFAEEEFESEDGEAEEEEFTEEPAPIEEEIIPEEEEWSDEPEVLDDEEEYDAIVLVPADDNPPIYENEYYAPESTEEEESVPELTNIYNNEVAAPVVTVENNVVVQPASSGTETSYDKFMVESLNELEAEKYYIQIATLRDDENILEIVNKYGAKYPITIVPAANGSKQVLVGPVTLDEYGTVLARFKAYGYKDAFLRKGTNPNPKAKGASASPAVDAK